MIFNKKGEQNYALIMAAVVAMVAVVGLVMWQQASSAGAANVVFMHEEPTYRSQSLPVYKTSNWEQGMSAGEDAAVTCFGERTGEVQCCFNVCASQPSEDARHGCTSICRLRTAQAHSIESIS